MRATRTIIAATTMLLLGAGLAGCSSQADDLEKQLQKAGYTNVSAEADYDQVYNKKKKKNEKKLDDYEAEAKAGNCDVEIEQDSGDDDYVIETAAGKDVNFTNLTASALVAELAKQGITC
ncbi:hypothetical protein Daura_38240 [Dactylosporangium aurantiacum]|uniref:Lipoprotein n=1 Tax=Dactylosporangium aurantiacum TaxID=35754 RepID=A0A9Q9MHB1_9ACTN|nr:hypothetical protein [Dactylosporangium aurantiacum]MDG6101739.1 hypothetical protein [Dactylosporangium aurantiacum]UWZ52451.1 hypothetical protein Daura_38240 [Dactylosporangium aurantiacum]